MRLSGHPEPLHSQGSLLETYVKSLKDTARTIPNERAIATLAPAESNPAVRAPPALSSDSSGGLSRHSARSLRDWEVEDFVLLATVDGSIYAVDRKDGTVKWHLQAERPVVQTTYHPRNRSSDDLDISVEDFLWIVEPSHDGRLYIYTPGPNAVLQHLGLTVRQLAEEYSPYAGDFPPVVYTAEKRNTLYTIDASTGKILKRFSSSGSSVLEEKVVAGSVALATCMTRNAALREH